MDENQLVQLFRELSISSCYIPQHPETGASLQEGFVEFLTRDDALKATQILGNYVPTPGARPLSGYIKYILFCVI
jgi:RNA recognition motif-containing protein